MSGAAAPAVRQVGLADIGELMPPGPVERRQPLDGFDPEYADIVDYIVRCTHRIWEEKAVGLIDSHYKHDAVVRSPLGKLLSREEVVADTLRSLAAFPDRRIYADEVVWTGDDRAGFYTSHLITTVGRNTGWSAFGPPTGRKVAYRVVANCVVHRNRIAEEWVVRDTMAVVRQLGLDPCAAAGRIAREKLGRGEDVADWAEVDRLRGQLPPADEPALAGEHPDERTVCQGLHDVWNRRRFDRVRELYAPTAVAHMPGWQELSGHNALIGWAVALLGMMPDGALALHHVCSVPEAGGRRRVAVRWALDGHHDGPGRTLGAPTGKRLHLPGTSHFRLQAGRVVEEWTVFDELALLVQLEMQA